MDEKQVSIRNELADTELLLKKAYVLLCGIFVADAFLHTTMFALRDHTFLHQFLRILLLLLIFAKTAYGEQYSPSKMMLSLAILFSFAIAYSRRSHYEILLDSMLLIIGANGVELKKILSVYFGITCILLMLTMVASQLGYVENLVYMRGDHIRIAFGIVYPTDFAAHVCYLMWAYIYLRKENLRYVELIVFAAIGGLVYSLCEARTSTICIFLTVLGCMILKIRKTRHLSESQVMQKTLASLIMPVCCSFFVLMTVFYSEEHAILCFFDRLFSSRLMLGKKGIMDYGFSLFGQFIPMVGAGGSVEAKPDYFFIDSSYMQLLLCYGLLVMVTVMIIYMVIGWRAAENGDLYLILILSVVSLHCMIEHHLMEYCYNPFTLAVFASMGKQVTDIENGRFKFKRFALSKRDNRSKM